MLKISANRRFLTHDDGKSFFYLGDTAWELFHRTTRTEAQVYLDDRAAKGFTVIQAVVLAEVDGLHTPNTNGDLPLVDDDPTQPNEAYFQHVDQVMEYAAALGLHIGMLPTWGDKWNQGWGTGPEIFTPQNAYTYGQWLAKRYADAPVLWILGGDRPVETQHQRAVIEAMATGLREGDGGTHLISFHPPGGRGSSDPFHDAAWLDFNMYQSGHSRNQENWRLIAGDYARTPTKPCMDAEPGYEDHPASFDLNNGYLDDYDTRKSLYWGLFAGGHGHTYGCHPLWQLWQADRAPISWVRRTWQDALHLPGSGQQQHAKHLILSRPFFERVPDQALIVGDGRSGSHHVQATCSSDGSYAFVYLPFYEPVDIDLDRLSGDTLTSWWYNPRTGTAQQFDSIARSGTHTFTPPSGGPDWVLVLDDTARTFGQPGAFIYPSREEQA